MSFSHRAGSLRQDNKKHKTAHQSKRASKAALGAGRVAAEKDGAKHGHKRALEARKQNRANHGAQMRKKKREDVWVQKRLGADGGPPKLCVWVSLSEFADTRSIQDGLLATAARRSDPRNGATLVSASFSQFKQRMTFLDPGRDLLSVLEYAKVADMVLVVLPVQEGPDAAIDEVGEATITALKAAGLPAVVGVLQGLDRLKGKRQSDMRKWGQRFFETEFAGQAKAVDASNSSLVARSLSTMPVRRVHWRSVRSYVLADSAKVLPVTGSGEDGRGTLHVRGYLRGRPLSVNQLVHIGDAGHFRLRQINSASEPFPIKPRQGGDAAREVGSPVGAAQVGEVLAKADPEEQEDLNVEAAVDDLAGEQTWPTEQELAQAGTSTGEDTDVVDAMVEQDGEVEDERQSMSKARPSGWSGYQADWLAGSNPADGGVLDDSDEGEAWTLDEDGEEPEAMEDEGEVNLEAQKRRVAEDEDSRFPDEVDTPIDRPARERFARYRALKSFRTSPWDPKETLPKDYARIFQFEDFAAMQKDVLAAGEAIERQQRQQVIGAKASSTSGRRSRVSSRSSVTATSEMELDEDQESAQVMGLAPLFEDGDVHVPCGRYVEIIVEDVPADVLTKRQAAQDDQERPLVLFFLLRHEHRLSTLHFNITRDPRYTEVLPSKEPLIFHCGFRSWTSKPVYSQVNLNCDKHKFERFLRPDRFTAATVYGPTTYQPCPVLVFKEVPVEGKGTNRIVLVATGMLLGVDPDRVMLKKIVLTGYPIRVRKRRAVVKHMFHRPEDVKWFKPAELVTKYGLTGHIKEPVGTHGLMKVIFNKAVKQNDTVCLNLYKRVYPKMVDGKVVVR